MKEKICQLFVLCGVLICIFSIFGCDFVREYTGIEGDSSDSIDKISDKNDSDSAQMGSETNSINETLLSEETTIAEFVECNVFLPDENLIRALLCFIDEFNVEYGLPESSISIKIDQIRSGAQPLQIKFDPNDYYYVCAYYYNDKHDHYEDFRDYCCADEYTWVGFYNEIDITENYGVEDFIVAFQINRTELCRDLSQGDVPIPDMEHFQLYTPVFEKGVNIAESLAFGESFIYLNTSNKDTVYYNAVYDRCIHELVSMPYIELDGKYYIVEYLYTDESRADYEDDIKWRFGDYYDQLSMIMITEKYSAEDKFGRTVYYGLFEINEFVNAFF